jgi:hypothetical protein
MKKVNYSEYEGKYNESIKEKLEKDPESVNVDTMRANIFGYTFTKEYAIGEIPNELSMDYWEKRNLEIDFENPNFEDCEIPDVSKYIRTFNNIDSLLEDVDDNPYFDVSSQEKLLLETIDSTGDGKTPETALCVIDVHQEYEYIQRVVRLSVLHLVKQSVKNGIDCLELEDYDGRIEKVYFDISRRFEVGYLNQ